MEGSSDSSNPALNLIKEDVNGLRDRVAALEQSSIGDDLKETVNDLDSKIVACTEDLASIKASVEKIIGTTAKIGEDLATNHANVSSRLESINQLIQSCVESHATNGEVLDNVYASLTKLDSQLPNLLQTAMNNAYASSVNAIQSSITSVRMEISTLGTEASKALRNSVDYQTILADTANSVTELRETSDRLQEIIVTAERYAQFVSDCLAIQQLQTAVLDMSRMCIEKTTELSNAWEQDRRELYECMAYLRDSGFRREIADYIYKAISSFNMVTTSAIDIKKASTKEVF